MIDELAPYLSEEQINKIVGRIQMQYKRYKFFSDKAEASELFIDAYRAHKSSYALGWAIDSAFPPDTSIAGFSVSALHYGKGHVRPELRNGNLVVHILGNLVAVTPEYLKEYFSMNDKKQLSPPIYCYFRYYTVKDSILIDLCLPDCCGNLISCERIQKPLDFSKKGA